MLIYFVVQESVHDQAGLDTYGKAAGPTMANVGSRALAVDNDVQAIEGEYQAALPLRIAATDLPGALSKGLR
jgi:uncharacterized protein (DUF1330 family)